MALPRYTVHASSVLVLAGLLSLLLADSAEPQCEATPFDETFDISTTCGGGHSGRVRIIRDLSASVLDDSAGFAREDVTRVSGDIDVQSGSAIGSCAEEDEPIKVTGMSFTVPAAPAEGTSGTGLETATCKVNLVTDLGKDVACSSPDGPITACTIRVTFP